MIRGTTPVLEFTLPFETDLLEEAYVTIAQMGTVVIEKSIDECTLKHNMLSVRLPQEETLKLIAQRNLRAEIQLRVLTRDGEALASNIETGQRIVGTMTQSSGIDTSDATALSEDIVSGKTAYVDGEKVVGSMEAINASKLTVGTGRINLFKDREDLGMIFNSVSLSNESAYIKNGDSFRLYGNGTLGEYFGDAMPEDVRKGKKFTSKDGVATGTMEVSGGDSGGVQVKTGTTSSPTIETGLSKIDKLIIYADKITSVGVVTAVYSAGKAKVTFCGDYSVYSKPCGITDRSGFSVSGGTFSWTESAKEYKFMNNTTYNWIAIGS